MNALIHVYKMIYVRLPKDLTLLVSKYLPRDDQKKLLVYVAMHEILPTDLIELVVCYLNYSEAQKVFLALHYHKQNYYDSYNWRTFSTDVDETRPEWWEDIEFMHVNTHPADQMTACNENDWQWVEGDQYYFHINFGNRYELYELGTINNLTVEDLLPSKGFHINMNPHFASDIFEQCRPKYLTAMQATIDKIFTS